MQLDAAILIILAIFVILGFKNGFAHTVSFALGWLVAFAVAFFTRAPVREFLTERTPLYDWYYGHVYDICTKLVSGYAETFTGGAAADALGSGVLDSGVLDGGVLDGGAAGVTDGALDSALESLGGVSGALGDAVGSIGSALAQETAEQIASASFGMFSFIGTVLVVKFLLFLITAAVSRKYHGGFVGAMDAVGGMFLGVAQGFVIVFLLLLVILPVSLAVSQSLFESVSHALDTSFFAKTLFLHNPLAALVDGFAPGLFDPAAWIEKLSS